MKVLVDTNIILDAIANRVPFNKEAEEIFLISANNIILSYISASSVTDIYYLIRKYLHSKEEAKKIMIKLFSIFSIVDVTSFDCIEAISLKIDDYEDAVISSCALHNSFDYILTRNIKDYVNSSVRAIEPKEFLRLVKEI